MFTTKSINNKKAKKRMQNRTDNDFNYAQEARSQYDELVKQRSRVTSEKKIADLDEQIKDFMHVSEIRTYLKFANGPVIAQNVTFGKTNSKQEPTLYGFTCVLSKKGDTVIIPVNSTDDIMPFATAKNMVVNGSLIRAYQSASRKFLSAETTRIARAQSDAMTSALGVALTIGDEADQFVATNALMAALLVK